MGLPCSASLLQLTNTNELHGLTTRAMPQALAGKRPDLRKSAETHARHFCRNSDGLIPVACLKVDEKCWEWLKPDDSAMLVTLSSIRLRRCLAYSMRRPST